jgi:hypothetical protein
MKNHFQVKVPSTISDNDDDDDDALKSVCFLN